MPTGGDAVPDGYEEALTKLASAGVTDIDTARSKFSTCMEWIQPLRLRRPCVLSTTCIAKAFSKDSD